MRRLDPVALGTDGPTPPPGTPPKVLHIVETMGRGATENLLLRTLEHARKSGIPVDWSFYCTLPDAGFQTPRSEALGARVVASPVPIGHKLNFVRALRCELKRGRYDVLHAHHDLVSGVYLLAAVGLKMRRVVHVHNAGEAVLTDDLLKQLILRWCLRATCIALANKIVAVSNHALDTFLAGRRRRAFRDLVLYSGVDISAFALPKPDRTAFRKALNLEPDASIILFAGRMVPEKNPVFLVDVLHQLHRAEPKAYAVFAGSGPEEGTVDEHARRLGLRDRIRLLGWRDDLPQVMQCADLFILPSPEDVMEGFGLAVVEAQLAGLRLLLSRGIADDPILPHAKFQRLALDDGAQAWADAALQLLDADPPKADVAKADLAVSPMAMDRALYGILDLYK